MQFRERRRVIQVIRTTYDPDLKRGRSEVLGKIDKAAPAITDKLHKACTPEELSEITTYLATRQNTLRDEAVRAGAETLPAQMRAAAEYFRSHRDEEAKDFAVEIRAAWDELKAAMRKAGFSKGKVKKSAEKDRDKASAPKVDAAPAAEVVATPPADKKPVPEKKPAAAEKPVPKARPARKAAVPKRTETAAVALATAVGDAVPTPGPVVVPTKPDGGAAS
ncbi:hypothetical protein [Azospirillum sp. sgz302134]